MIDEDKERHYQETFASVCRQLSARRQRDPGFTRRHLQGLLDSALVHRGNDWTGRGPAAETADDATIAAYECVLSTWHDDAAEN